MTVIAQDDHLTAGAWAACAPSRPSLRNVFEKRVKSLRILAVILTLQVKSRSFKVQGQIKCSTDKSNKES